MVLARHSSHPEWVSSLISTSLSLVGGVAIGGWIAFESSYWQVFRSLVERIPVGSALSLGLVLVVAAAGISFVTALGPPSGSCVTDHAIDDSRSLPPATPIEVTLFFFTHARRRERQPV